MFCVSGKTRLLNDITANIFVIRPVRMTFMHKNTAHNRSAQNATDNNKKSRRSA